MLEEQTALRNLVDIARVFEARGSRYMLSDGTLLGAVREGRFISWDTDTDVMVLIEGFDPRVLRDLLGEGFRLTRCFGFPHDGMEWTLEREGVRTDFFFVYPRKESWYLSAYWWDNADGTAEWIDYVHPPLEQGWIELLGQRFRAPADPEPYLARCYGESWRVPDENWDYRGDPPNAVRRPVRIRFADSVEAIADYLRRQAGIAIEREPGWVLPFVRMELAPEERTPFWLS